MITSIEKEDDVLIIKTENRALAMALAQHMNEMDGITVFYRQEHPLKNEVELRIKGKNAKGALAKALKEIEEMAERMEKEIGKE
ncbi:MAG: RpoL/Rpb11 RNA polymerase subunit family protein [Candidatus Anstonellales archaeon]